ncbi:MAG: sulfatase-like hydrolase/transferase [Rickettsiales bacterium]|jgi:hypothetical protein|nr:sulfatase-like hydrolase/transferase [Rickettsiales bacterium]
MKNNFLGLVLESCTSLVCTYLIIFLIDKKYGKIRKVLSVVFGILYFLQSLSLVTIAHDINYTFLSNLFDFTNYVAAFSVYRKYSVITIFIIILFCFILYFCSKKINIRNVYLKYLTVVVLLVYLATPYSTIVKLAKVCYKLRRDPDSRKTHEQLFEEITGTKYINYGDLTTAIDGKPKNLVLIIIESYEQTFLEGDFKNLTKDMISYSEEGEFYSDIDMINGSGWTMAGTHTILCGSPRIYSLTNNYLFKTASISKLICLSDILHHAGYFQMYLGGDTKEFAGKGQFLQTHKYDEIRGRNDLRREYKLSKKYFSGWGIQDREIFWIAKEKYRELSKMGKPFNLTLSTLITHGPNGLEDSRCRNTTGNTMLDCIECENDLIADFIDFLKNEPNYKDTLVVMLPDHLMMGCIIDAKLNAAENRKLYAIMLNSAIKKKESGTILYTDLAPIILKKLNVKHNAKFLMENHKNEINAQRIKYLDENFDRIRLFNDKTIMHE